MTEAEDKFLLKDHLFNAETVGQMAGWFGLDAAWIARVTAGFPERELKARIAWIADCLEPELPAAFPQMAEAIEAALPPPLDPTLSDDDFGEFIIAPLGVLAERHGMQMPERGLDLIEALTQRFSMEFALRPFLNAHPDRALARLEAWCAHPNYHVRRLVSEGTRARLPWAPRITLDPMRPLPLLERLHADRTRYVTRSVANHLGDIAKLDLGTACDALDRWNAQGRQAPAELDWMTRHALRAQIKAGEPAAMRCIGVIPGAPVRDVSLTLSPEAPRIGEAPRIEATLTPEAAGTLVVDYEITFATASGRPRKKVFKLKTVEGEAGRALTLGKAHRLKGGATTFTLHPGPHELRLMVNGTERALLRFALLP